MIRELAARARAAASWMLEAARPPALEAGLGGVRIEQRVLNLSLFRVCVCVYWWW